jgi:23S rRNA pseudouridine1911/1915/1917 synthase
LKIDILFEDKYILAVDKPAGVLAYPLPGSSEKTLGDMVKALPCHRLDRDTSGVMLLAKNEKAKLAMQKLFSERKIEKTYAALVRGKVEPMEGEIKIPLGRGTKDRLRVVPSALGRESHTIYSVRKYFPESNTSLLDVDLKTGRTHQIRVHFNAIGHPVVGDKKYSHRDADIPRQFLHATKVGFVSPFDGKKMEIVSKLPAELKNYLSALN